MSDPLAGLLATLDLTDTGARTSEDIFTGPSQYMPGGRIYGGQVLAQSLVAATRPVSDDRFVHSMHGYFLRPGDVELPITFSVDRIHDGRSFSTRRTQAYQKGVPILSMIASFQDVDDGVEHFAPPPAEVPDPDTAAVDRRPSRRHRPPGRPVLGDAAGIRHPAHRQTPVPLGGRGPGRRVRGVDEGGRHPARRPQPAPGRHRLRE
jgi:acyl-CoA thioesterase